MSEIATTLSLGVEFLFQGKTYRVAPCCYLVQGHFEQYLESLAHSSIMKRVEEVPDFVIREMLSLFQRDCAARVYHFNGTVAQRALAMLPGRKYLAVLQLHKGTTNLPLDKAKNLVECIYDSGDTAIQVLEDAMTQADLDPNKAKPYLPIQ